MQQKYETLSEGNKHNRRTVADAVDLLIKHAGFQSSDSAKIRTIQFPLAAKEPLAQLCIVFQRLDASVTFLVWLPTSSRFTARASDQTTTKQFNTPDLNEASVDYSGNVALRSGAQLKAVEVIPASLPFELSDLDRRILMSTISFMKIEDLVFRTLGEELDPEARATLPVIRAIDFQRLRGLEMPLLKQLQAFMAESGDFIKTPSLQKISTTLSNCGMRTVERRRHSADFQASPK
jgi:hypothetical protein